MSKKASEHSKPQIALAALIVGGIICLITVLFVRSVQNQLWEQSVGTIIESTRQGRNTLQVQLEDEFVSLGTLSGHLTEYEADAPDVLEDVLAGYSSVDNGTGLYLSDGRMMPSGAQADETVRQLLEGTTAQKGIINPHISSVTGVNVFDLYVRTTLSDGTVGYLVKEYAVGDIVDSFTLSFYNDTGFSYVVDTKGNVLIRPPHPNSNKTVQNLFDMLPASENDGDILEQFRQTLAQFRTGWAVFSYGGEDMVFGYTPLELGSDWYLISIIPKNVVDAQTNRILTRTLALVACIIVGLAVLVIIYFRSVRRTNRKLKNQADYIGHLYNAVPEGIALMSPEHPHRFIQLNREGLRLLEYPPGSANDAPAGRPLDEVIFPDDYEMVAGIFADTVKYDRKNTYENRVLKADGGFFWASGIVEKMLDADGQPVLIATFHDITDEKLAAEALEREKQQERLTLVRAISNAYPVIISMNLTQDTLKYIYVKPGLMAGLGTQKTYSQLYGEFSRNIHPDSQAEFGQRFEPEMLRATLGQARGEVAMEARLLLADGNYHWISTQIISVDNPYSRDKLAILISRRIDEQKYEEAQQRQTLQSALESARAASLAKSQFLSNMSHDIRTPMNAIVGMTAIAAAHLEDRDRIVECLRKISLSSKHLLSLINDVLDMSKIESGKLSLRDEPFNFAELVSDMVELVRPEADAHGLTLDISLAVLKNENVVGDSLRIRQVCINILSNAVKYTPAGGHVQIEVRQEPCSRRGYGNYVFRCADTGMGMSQAFLEKLFQPFERNTDADTSKISGTGLGMAITKNLLDLMNGDIHVESSPGRGSVFNVTFPLQLQDMEPLEVPERWVGVHSLIVDDDRQTCENATELLEEMGLRACFVTDGLSAVRCALEAQSTSDPYALVIIDWKMPDMDGVAVARRLRAELGPDVPLIVLTAYDWSEIEAEAREAGVTAFLSKPFYRSKIFYLLSELDGSANGGRMVPGADVAAGHDYSGKRVLLVEDNEINREIATTLIGEMGVQVEEAVDGQEAVDRMTGAPEGYYQMILMDIQMPRMDGYAAARAIRSLPRADAATVPIVAMTANAFEEDVRAALRAGMNAHFAKPIDVAELERIMHRFLQG